MSVPVPKIPPVAIWLLTAALMALASWAVPVCTYVLPASRVIAVGFALVGAATSLLGVVSFRRARTTVNPLRPATSSTLVVTGLYRVSRNPMYLGFRLRPHRTASCLASCLQFDANNERWAKPFLVVLLGWAVFLSNAIAFAWLPAFVLFMNRGQIAAEEVALETRFGKTFAAYRCKVRRWL